MVSVLEFSGLFFEGPKNFLHPESDSKISDFVITELFYSHILNMNSGSLSHTRNSGICTSLFFLDTDELKMTLRTPKVSGACPRADLPIISPIKVVLAV